jgi:hypothetical protein
LKRISCRTPSALEELVIAVAIQRGLIRPDFTDAQDSLCA